MKLLQVRALTSLFSSTTLQTCGWVVYVWIHSVWNPCSSEWGETRLGAGTVPTKSPVPSAHLTTRLVVRVRTKYFQVLCLLSKQLKTRAHTDFESNQDNFSHSKTIVRFIEGDSVKMDSRATWVHGCARTFILEGSREGVVWLLRGIIGMFLFLLKD